MNKLDLTGQKFARLLVIGKPDHPTKRTAWLCKCDCGTTKIIKTDQLRSGDTKSCGCWNNEQRSSRAKTMYSKNIMYEPHITTARKIWRNRYSDMKFEDFYELSQQNCYYCGLELSNLQNAASHDTKAASSTIEKANFLYNGLDRIDNTLGHSKENCVPCCKYCNFAKRERSQEDFKIWITQVYKFFIKES